MKQLSFAIFSLENKRIVSTLLLEPSFKKILNMGPDDLHMQNISHVFPDFFPDHDHGSLYIGSYYVEYIQYAVSTKRTLLFLALLDSSDSAICQFAMDQLDIGVQIYRNDTTLMFINAASETMSNIERDDVLDKQLTSIYDTDEQHSTVLQVLSSKSPLYNKIAQFDVRSGGFTTVLNTSIPYFDASRSLRAVVNLEYNQASLERMAENAKKLQRIVPPNISSTSTATDSGKRYYHFSDIISQSPVFHETITFAKRISSQDGSVFIAGETGTGKEMFAQSIYSECADKYTAFVAVNCSTIPEELADSTLFGSVKGAFTGSISADGLFAAADGGILFLDEINSLRQSSQARLLRVLQEGTYMKVGSTKEISCNVRVLASSNQDPMELVQAGKFRSDLFYRLAKTVITIPPLRMRREDIQILTQHFLRYYSNKYMKNVSSVSERVQKLLNQYDWPGNVRELKNVIEFAVNTAIGPEIGLQDLPTYMQNKRRAIIGSPLLPQENFSQRQYSLAGHLEHYEKELIQYSLKQNGYNITKTAAALSLTRQTLQYKIKKYQLRQS